MAELLKPGDKVKGFLDRLPDGGVVILPIIDEEDYGYLL